MTRIVRAAAVAFFADDCLSRGAALAYYTVFALAPMLVIVTAVAGIVFGEAAARGAVVAQIGGLIGKPGADMIQAMIAGIARGQNGVIATTLALATLLIVATGVFAEIQSTLNVIWKVTPPPWSPLTLLRVRLIGLALVLVMGLLLTLSLVASTTLALAGGWLRDALPDVDASVRWLNFGVSFALITVTFALIYKLLPDCWISWRDVWTGAAITALLFTLGKNLIGYYIAHSMVATSYGAAGTLAVVLLWVYYCAQVFLFGAELTHAHARRAGRDPAHEGYIAEGAARDVARLRRALDASSPRRRRR